MMGKKTDRIRELEAELANVKGTNSVLEAWRKGWIAMFDNKVGNLQTTMSALIDLWAKLGVEHQTGAVMRLAELKKEARLGKAYKDLELASNQTTSSLRHQITTLELANRQLTHQRDSAISLREDQGFELANTKARVDELERYIRTAIVGLGDDNTTREDLETTLRVLRVVLGDDNAEV